MDYENLKNITINDYIKFLLEPILPVQLQIIKNEYIKFEAYKEPNEKFDRFGLRYDLDFLQKVKTRICLLPIQLMANFADKTTIESEAKFNKIKKFNIETYNYLNATTIGNTAHIFLNTTNDDVRQCCYDFLTKLIQYEIELSGLTAHFKQPQVIKPNFQA